MTSQLSRKMEEIQDSVEEQVGNLAETFKDEFGDGMAKARDTIALFLWSYGYKLVLRVTEISAASVWPLEKIRLPGSLNVLSFRATEFPLSIPPGSFSWRHV